MEYLVAIATLIVIFAILGMSLNLVVGYGGLLSVAGAAFAGIGAYATAILTTAHGSGFFTSLLVGVCAAAVAGFVIGLVLSRFSGDYYALVSIGFAIIVFSLFLNTASLTRGALGIPGIPRPVLFGRALISPFTFFVFSAVIAVLVYSVTNFVVHSSFGRVLMAIREDEQAIRVFGYRTGHYKLIAFVLSAMLAAVGGSLYASYLSFIDPATFAIGESIFLLVLIIFGGLGSLDGPLVGAAFLTILPEALRFVGFPDDVAAQLQHLVYGLLLIFFMRYRPQGILGEYRL